MEERARGVHVGQVLPGFISTEGFPQAELTARPWTRWAVSTPERAAEAIRQAGLGRRPERYVPRFYALAAVFRILTPGLVRRVMGGAGATVMTTTTAADAADRDAADRDAASSAAAAADPHTTISTSGADTAAQDGAGE
jgi:hypothetical protein